MTTTEQPLPRFRQLYEAVRDADALLDAEGLANRRADTHRHAARAAMPAHDPYQTPTETTAHYRARALEVLTAEGEVAAKAERRRTLADAANALRVHRAAIQATAVAAAIELAARAAYLDQLAREDD